QPAPTFTPFPYRRSSDLEIDPEGTVIPYVMPGFTDGGPFSTLGIQFYGFAPVFFPNAPAVSFSELYHGHDERIPVEGFFQELNLDRKSTRLNSSHGSISY